MFEDVLDFRENILNNKVMDLDINYVIFIVLPW